MLVVIFINNLVLFALNILFAELNNRIDRSQAEALCTQIEMRIDSDEEFESVYGEVISVKADKLAN